MSGNALSIIGGDQRQKKLASLLSQDDYMVKTYGLSLTSTASIKKYNTIKKALHGSRAVIGSIPFSKDNNTLFFFESAAVVTFDEFFKTMSDEGVTRLFAGVISPKIKEIANSHGVTATDILELDEMAVLNAIPTDDTKKHQG